MKKATDFIKWALLRAKRSSVPAGAALYIPDKDVGTADGAPWVYLFGTTGQRVTKSLLDERYANYYGKHNWLRRDYDAITASWPAEGRIATDCEGLLDCFVGDNVTAEYCYTKWCTDKGLLSDIDRPYAIGEAVFVHNGQRITHVGFVCGTLNGVPLVVEARGIRYGVVVTKLTERPWSHRGLVTKKLDYTEETKMIRFEVAEPMHHGEAYRAMQVALNNAGYGPLAEDGKWGNKSQKAFDRLISDYASRGQGKHVEVYLDGKKIHDFTVTEGA